MKWNQNFNERLKVEKNKLIKISDEDYFAVNALSNSGVTDLLDNPAKFKLPKKEKDCFIEGRAFHILSSEPGRESEIKVATKTRTSEQIKNGYLKPKSFNECKNWAKAIRGYKYKGTTLGQIFDECLVEMAIFWDQEFNGVRVNCKSKIDLISEKYKIIFDLKSAKDASKHGFQNAMYRDRYYYRQACFYRLNDRLKDYSFFFPVVEKEPPYCTALYHADEETMETAYYEIEKAAGIYQNGIDTGIWSSQYNEEPVELKPAGWFYYKQV